jgi:hypothetical protein
MYRQSCLCWDLGVFLVSKVVNLLIDIQLVPNAAKFSHGRYVTKIFADFNKVSRTLHSPGPVEVEPFD